MQKLSTCSYTHPLFSRNGQDPVFYPGDCMHHQPRVQTHQQLTKRHTTPTIILPLTTPDPAHIHPGQHTTDVLKEKALAQLRTAHAASKPFFLEVAPIAPHDGTTRSTVSHPLGCLFSNRQKIELACAGAADKRRRKQEHQHAPASD
jgi:hypothetical protein